VGEVNSARDKKKENSLLAHHTWNSRKIAHTICAPTRIINTLNRMSKVEEGKENGLAEPLREVDDSVWDDEVSIELYTTFIRTCGKKQWVDAISLADQILQIDPNNKIIAQYLPVLKEHRLLKEECDESGEEDSSVGEESSDSEDDGEGDWNNSIDKEANIAGGAETDGNMATYARSGDPEISENSCKLGHK